MQSLPPVVRKSVPSTLLESARILRQRQTNAEEMLWELVRGRRLNGLKFRRQHPIHRSFILDFFCARYRIAIELDGSGHHSREQMEYDEARTGILNDYGIRVLRFPNTAVINETQKVLTEILEACH